LGVWCTLYDIFAGISEHDNEGRVITAEFDDFYLVTACKCQGLKAIWIDTPRLSTTQGIFCIAISKYLIYT